jgi:hypothetical protein
MGTGLNFRNHAPPESAARWRKFLPVPIFYVTVIANKSTKPGAPMTLSVPDHPQLARGTLRALIAKAGLTVEEFLQAVR